MSSKNERKKGLGRGLSSFLDADSFEGFVDKENDKEKIINAPNSTTGSTGGGGAHSHPVSSPFTMSGSVSTGSASLSVPTMNVKHEEVIACTKD